MQRLLRLSLTLLAAFSLNAHATLVRFETNQGTIDIELYDDKAPVTVANFLKYVEDGSYEGSLFHRVIGNFMIQGGGFSIDYARLDANAPIQNESDNGLSNERGTIAMARTSNPHSATRQFFINLVTNPHLDASSRGYGYAVFGKVVAGMDVVDGIGKVATKSGPVPGMQNVPREKIILQKATVIQDPQSEVEAEQAQSQN